MNIIVCLKQVPNPDLQFQVAPSGTDIKRDALNYRVNGCDEYALEEAVRQKEKLKGKVTAITVGPKRTEQMLREAMAKGADEAVRVSYEDPAALNSYQVAKILAETVKKIPHDLVLTGVQSDDYLYSQTGAMMAGFLGCSHVSVVTKVTVEGQDLKLNRELEGGDQEVVMTKLPALLTIQSGINQPRYAPLPAVMKAARAPIREIKPQDLGAQNWDQFVGGFQFKVRKVYLPAARGKAEMFTGKPADSAAKVAQLIKDKGFWRGG